MRVFGFVLACVALLATYSPAQNASPKQQLLKLPLSFEPNVGQTDAAARFLARGSGYVVFLTDQGAVLKLRNSGATNVLRMSWLNAHARSLTGEMPLEGRINYLRGNIPSKWETGIPTYGRVHLAAAYPGVDIAFYGNGEQLEYDVIVSPQADLSQVRMRLEGAKSVHIDASGDLVIALRDGELRQHRPVVYQTVNGKRQRVEGAYVLFGGHDVGFRVGAYDHSRDLVIDPTLSYATFLGGKYTDQAYAVAPDASGNAYVTGTTVSPDFPKKNAYEGDRADYDAFLTKLNSTGSGLVYSTYLGGSGVDEGRGVGVDRYGYGYVVGTTTSTNFPVTSGAYQTVNKGGRTIFVTKFNPSGTGLVFSTYIGGTGDQDGYAMSIDSTHRVYVTGVTNSSDFPLKNAFQSAIKSPANAYVLRLSADGKSLSYSSYLGGTGSNGDFGLGIAVDSSNQAYVAGVTNSMDFPTTAGAYDRTSNGGGDAFVTKVSADGASLVYSTYFGSGVGAEGIAVDSLGRAYITGGGEGSVPVTSGAFQKTRPGLPSSFVARFTADGTGLSYSTYLGGTNEDFARSIAVDSTYHAYVIGEADSADFPVKNTTLTSGRLFVTKLWATGGGLIWSARYGGDNTYGRCVRLDGSGNPYVTGVVASSNSTTVFKATPGAFDITLGGLMDGFVLKLKN